MGQPGHSRHDPRGQVLVIVAVGIVVLIGMVGLVVDGGYAWGQQRETQNGADAVAKAGTVVVQHLYAEEGSPTDGDVGCAVEAASTANDVDLVSAVYTDFEGTPLVPEVEVGACPGAPGGGAAIPEGAQGVQATTSQEFETFLARVMGFTQFTATADATAVVAPLTGICPAGSGCSVLPVTFPLSAVYCDGTNNQVSFSDDEWNILEETEEEPSVDNMVIIPLCSTGAGTESPGSVGWLDYGCGNLSTTIEEPCNLYIPIPGWVATQTGNVNSVEDELNGYGGTVPNQPDDEDTVVPLPIHDNTCSTQPPHDDPVCPGGAWSGTGDNLYYHVPYWVGFMVDQAYVQGDNRVECNSPPGYPSGIAAGSGATSCLKGWFFEKYSAPGAMGTGDLEPGDLTPFGILLVE